MEHSEESITAIFDQLVSDGVILYSPYEVVRGDCGGYPLEFRICPSLAKKPQTVDAVLDPSLGSSREWGPGSDMFCPDERLILGKLNNTHELALNLFCVDRPQLLLLTLDSFKRQHEPLDLDDLKACTEMMKACPSMYAMFNCGEPSGCSRVHKHMQGLRGPPTAFQSIIQPDDQTTVPFRYFKHHFDGLVVDISPSEIIDAYSSLLFQSRKALDLDDGDSCPHNVVLWNSWLIMIPRRKSTLGNASANTPGMLGSIWVSDRASVDEWLSLGCRHVLGELGLPIANH